MGELLCRKLEELESVLHCLETPPELHFSHAESFRIKLSFLKSLLAAEVGSGAVDADASRLSQIAARISALDAVLASESPEEAAIEDTKPAVSMRHTVLRKNLEELESMQNTDPFDAAAAQIQSKIDFTKSLLATERPRCGESKNLFHMATRLAALEADLNDAMPSLCSCTPACLTGEAEEKDVVAPGLAMLKRKIEELEKDINVDGFSDAFRKIAFVKSLLVAEMRGSGTRKVEFDSNAHRLLSINYESKEPNWFAVEGGEGGVNEWNQSSPCSCTSFCFDGVEGENKGGDDGNSEYSGCNGTGDVRSLVTQKIVVDCNSETAVSRECVELVEEEKRGDLKRGFQSLRAVGAVVGVFAVAATVTAVGRFFGSAEPFHLVPT